jgi:signal peptidase II
VWVFSAVFIVVFLLDRILKMLVFENFSLGDSYPVLRGVLHVTPVQNIGIAFGLFDNLSNVVFICVSAFILLSMLYLLIAKRPKSVFLLLGFSLIFSGAAGNLIDRIFYGYVFDFIDLRVWPVFNLADSAITIGAGLIVVYILSQNRKGKRKK